MKEDELVESEELDVYKLILKLRQEKLFIVDEKNHIKKLNELVSNKIKEVTKSAWITTKQRLLLCQREIALSLNYQKIENLHNSVYVKAKDAIGYQASMKIGNILQVLRTQPQQLANWLSLVDKNPNELNILHCIISGLYSYCTFPEDTKFMLVLLHELAKLEFLKCDNPRRLIKQRTCAFKTMFFLFNDVQHSAKFFLNATFQMPILHLMSLPEMYLDLDPEKTTMRYKQSDKNLTESEYRSNVVAQLAKIVNSFITSMLENVYSFPKSIAWIVHHVSKIIEKSFDAKEANAVVTELIFTLYICPIILDPEQFGLYNSQVTDIARHNLIQVGQILQCLALSTYEPIDLKFIDLFSLLDKSRFNDFFEMLFYDIDNEPPVDVSPQLNRTIFLFTEQELNILISFLQKVQTELGDGDHFNKELFGSFDELNFINSRDNSPKTSRPNSNETIEISTSFKKSTFFNIGLKNNKPSDDNLKTNTQNMVLIFPLDGQQCEPIGLLSEEKVLNNISIQKSETIQDTVNQNGHIKQSYTNYPDEGSIGNTSDNLEAISEAASNHSVDSSIELENEDQNDNLSDMVSANVSGRGTPNISGRDTPSSQVIENDDRTLEVRQVDVVQPQPQISRQIRSEIDDKFCKFEIKKLLAGDETISIISDTWSTDVLASDNETIDANEQQRPSLVEQAIHEVHDEVNNQTTNNILDISETQSESAWSTDVMASDTDRLTEVDQDDVGSVAQSDEVRSEIDDNVVPSNSVRRLSSVSQTNNITNGKSEQQIDNNANNVVYKSITLTSDSQQITHNSISYSEHTFKSTTMLKTTTSSVTMVNNSHVKDDLPNIPGPSGLNKRVNSLETEPDCSIYTTKHINNTNNNQNNINCKKDERPNEILLSNCSLNSSSSGSSSSNSFENNKNSHTESSEKWENKQWLNSSGSSLNATLTPSESTSELSILSGNNPSNLLINKKSATLLCTTNRNLKPSASTGAIPKSISFDMTADKGLIDDEQRNKRGSFFGKLKIGFRNRRGKSFRNHIDDFTLDNEDYVRKSGPESPIKVNNLGCGMVSEIFESPEASDDILAKYRTKPFVESSPIKESCDVIKSPKERICGNSTNNSEINSFNDIKNKLRLVLSNTSEIPHYIKIKRISVKNKIETVLLIELGKARKLKDWSNVARISEAIRCINLLNSTSCLKLLQSMKDDILLRTTYIQYLNCSTQELLFCKMYLKSLSEQIMHEKEQSEQYLAAICVREILSPRDEFLNRLYDEYKNFNLIDEKIDYLLFFYDKMFTFINKSELGQNVLRDKEKEVQIILERMLMNNVYINSLYPNGDGDRDRDSILREHIEKLSKIISPHHKDLNISKIYLRECPWIPAQDALKGLNAYRTPRDKIYCIVHCAKCIMDLLSMSQNNGTTTADDFTPVLVFVIIKVNPEALLSNIQFVNSFTVGDPPRGEEQYWWTQFCSAVEFIKTMDYSD